MLRSGLLRPIRITAPASLPITVDEAKAFCRVDGSEEDGLIEGLIAAAVDYLDGRAGILGRCMVTQVWRYSLDSMDWRTDLGMPGAVSVEVSYVDPDGERQNVAAEYLRLLEETRGSCVSHDGPPFLPRDYRQPVRIDATFGTDVAEVSASLKQAIRLLVAHWHLNREAIGDGRADQIPLGFDAMVAPHRWRSL